MFLQYSFEICKKNIFHKNLFFLFFFVEKDNFRFENKANAVNLPFSSNCSCVLTYSVGNVIQISMPPVIPPATIPFKPVEPPAAAAAPLFSIHGRCGNGFLRLNGIKFDRLESIFSVRNFLFIRYV